MDEFDDMTIHMPGNSASYSSILKELTETTLLIFDDLAPKMVPEEAAKMCTQMLSMLNIEIQIQLAYQQDQVKEIMKMQAKDNIKSANVIPLKGK